MANMKKAVFFDMDGVLVLTEIIKAEAHVAATEILGGKANINLYIEMLGQSHESIRSAYIQAAGIQADPEIYTKYYRRIYHGLLEEKLVVRPGAKELVNRLHDQGFSLAVVSSSSTASITKILKSISLEDAFEVQVTSDDTKERKPDPAPYMLALKKLSISAQDAIVLEDSPSGVEAAIRAGVRVIAVRHNFNMKHTFDGAIAILDSFEDPASIISLIQSILKEE